MSQKMEKIGIVDKFDDFDTFITFLDRLAKVIAEMFGPNCEVTVSDVDNADESVLLIYNGEVTGRKVGSPIDPEAKKRLILNKEGCHINYRKNVKANGKNIKSSTIVTEICGRNISFCINFDCTMFENLQFSLDSFLTMEKDRYDLADPETERQLHVQDMINDELRLLKKPVGQLNKKERQTIIMNLQKKGVFSLKKSIPIVAESLGISRYTVYNYLNALEEEKI